MKENHLYKFPETRYETHRIVTLDHISIVLSSGCFCTAEKQKFSSNIYQPQHLHRVSLSLFELPNHLRLLLLGVRKILDALMGQIEDTLL